MLVLALDTSSAAGSAAIVRDGTVIIERAGDPTRTHGERLPRELMALLDEARAPLRAIDRFAVCIGPGSFTGLRVGIATMQGLALAQGARVVPVSAFEALAASPDPAASVDPGVAAGVAPGVAASWPEGRGGARREAAIAVWIDARRGEVFATLYAADGTTELAPQSALGPDATLDSWQAALGAIDRVRFVGDAAVTYQDVIRARLGGRASVAGQVPALAGTIGLIAAAADARATAPHAVVPLYVRRPDAELARDRRRASPER